MVTGCVLLCAGMWGLVNNAGISTFGEVEFTSMETYKEVAEVNLWGTVRTTKSFLPLLRRAKGELGRESLPAHPSLYLSNFSFLFRMETPDLPELSSITARLNSAISEPCWAWEW